MTPKTKTTFLSDTKNMILAILARQNFNNLVSGGIYLRPQVLMVPKMQSLKFCMIKRTGGRLLKSNLHLTGQLISWRPTNQQAISNIQYNTKILDDLGPYPIGKFRSGNCCYICTTVFYLCRYSSNNGIISLCKYGINYCCRYSSCVLLDASSTFNGPLI